MAGAIAFNVIPDSTNFKCTKLVSKITMKRTSEEKTIGFLERSPKNNPRVFIKDNEDIEIYFPNLNENEYAIVLNNIDQEQGLLCLILLIVILKILCLMWQYINNVIILIYRLWSYMEHLTA